MEWELYVFETIVNHQLLVVWIEFQKKHICFVLKNTAQTRWSEDNGW